MIAELRRVLEFTIFKIKDYFQVETILALLRSEHIQVLEMQLQQPDLEEVFVKIMGAESSEVP